MLQPYPIKSTASLYDDQHGTLTRSVITLPTLSLPTHITSNPELGSTSWFLLFIHQVLVWWMVPLRFSGNYQGLRVSPSSSARFPSFAGLENVGRKVPIQVGPPEGWPPKGVSPRVFLNLRRTTSTGNLHINHSLFIAMQETTKIGGSPSGITPQGSSLGQIPQNTHRNKKSHFNKRNVLEDQN